MRSVIPVHVMQHLGVLSLGDQVAEYAGGRKDTVMLREPIHFEILGRGTQDEALVLETKC